MTSILESDLIPQHESTHSMSQSTTQARPLPAGLPRLSTPELQKVAAKLRIDILDMIFEAQSGHPGSSLSCIDLLVNIWFAHLVWDPANPEWKERDRFVMSKGHGAPAYYATLMQAGY